MNLRPLLGAALLASIILPAAASDCRQDWELGKRMHAPFDLELARRMPETVILGRVDTDAPLTAEQRPLAELASVLNVWFDDRSTDELFRVLFTGPVGDQGPAIAKALKAIGADKQAAAIDGAIAAFGRNYPASDKRSAVFGPYAGPPTDIAKAVLALAPAFGTRSEFVDALAAYACSRPDVTAWLAAERAKMSENDRVVWLGYTLLTSRSIGGPPEKVAAQLAELPETYRTLYLVRYADFEVGNGGVHQLFSNSSGNIAAHVPEALRRIGTAKEAELVERGLAMFPQPYPTERSERDRVAFGTTDPRTGKPKNPTDPTERWGAFDDELSALTEQGWSYEAIEPASLAYAKRENIVPR